MGVINNEAAIAYLNNKLVMIAHPIGSIMMTSENKNPSETVGGTWVAHTDSGVTFNATYLWRRVK